MPREQLEVRRAPSQTAHRALQYNAQASVRYRRQENRRSLPRFPMNTERESGAQLPDGHGSLVALALLALVVGATTGLICAGFRAALEQADRFRDFLIGWAHGQAIPGFVLVVVACGLATFLAAWLVFRLAPHAVGIGIPHVEAVLRGQLPPAPSRLGGGTFAGRLLS